MPNVIASEVQYAGDFDSSIVTATMLASAAFIPAGDGWLNNILSNNGYASLSALTTADANKGALAKAAECYYVAALVASRPSKDDYRLGPAESKQVRDSERSEAVKRLMGMAKDQLGKAGLAYEEWGISYAGGDDYHPEGEENTQIDFGIASTGDGDWNLLGVEEA